MEYKGYRFDGLYKEAEKDIIDELKDEVAYLKKKINNNKYREEDLEDELGEMSYKKGKLEKEMERIVRESIEIKKDVKEQRIKEEEIDNKNKELGHKLKDIISELKDARDIITEKEDMEKKFDMKKEISDDIIGKLKKENEILNFKMLKQQTVLEEELKKNEIMFLKDQEYDALLENVEQMKKEIKYLEETNKEKQSVIISLSEESKKAKDDLQLLHVKSKVIGFVPLEEEIPPSLFEEIHMSEETSPKCLNDFQCDVCSKTFDNKRDQQAHIRNCHEKHLLDNRQQEIQNEILNQRMHLFKQMAGIKETEIKEVLLQQRL